MKSFKKKVILGLAAVALAMPFVNVQAKTIKLDWVQDSMSNTCPQAEGEVCTTEFDLTITNVDEEGALGRATIKITPKSAEVEKITNFKVTLADGYTGENGETEIEVGSGLASYEFVVNSEEVVPAGQATKIATVHYNHALDMDDCGVLMSINAEQAETEQPEPVVIPTEDPTPSPVTGVSVPALVLGGTAIVALGVYAVTTKKSKIKNI